MTNELFMKATSFLNSVGNFTKPLRIVLCPKPHATRKKHFFSKKEKKNTEKKRTSRKRRNKMKQEENRTLGRGYVFHLDLDKGYINY